MTDDAVPYAIDHTDPFPKVWPDPTPAMLDSPQFEAVWQCIKRWDIAVPDAYAGHCGATGNHVRAILDALAPFLVHLEQLTLRPDPSSLLVVSVPPGMCPEHVYEDIVTALRSAYANVSAWEHVRLPVVFVEDGIALEQIDEQAMRDAGWVRLPETPQEDAPA
jgi:hypothetical protein